MYQIITLDTLNIHNVVCQLYLNKAGKKELNVLKLVLKLVKVILSLLVTD